MNTQQVYQWAKCGGFREVLENCYVKGEKVSVVTDWEEGKVQVFCFDWVYDSRGYALVDVYKGSEFRASTCRYSLKIPMTPEGKRTGQVWKHHRHHAQGRQYGAASGVVRLEVEKEVCKSLIKEVA